jgi:hypothetical protein
MRKSILILGVVIFIISMYCNIVYAKHIYYNLKDYSPKYDVNIYEIRRNNFRVISEIDYRILPSYMKEMYSIEKEYDNIMIIHVTKNSKDSKIRSIRNKIDNKCYYPSFLDINKYYKEIVNVKFVINKNGNYKILNIDTNDNRLNNVIENIFKKVGSFNKQDKELTYNIEIEFFNNV